MNVTRGRKQWDPTDLGHAKVGFIGAGSIGFPMAKNIVTGGFPLVVFDVSPEPLRELEACGAEVAATPAELGQECGIIGICVNNDDQVEQVFVGDGGLLGGAKPDTIIAIHSTIRPRTVLKLASLASPHGIHINDKGGTPHV